ncbi:MAG: nucleotidyltransferase domain-containing protein [Cryobacterium sp.]|nr:nucleotidyltransferase domain-containing protein [Oligoflexia bacterium]
MKKGWTQQEGDYLTSVISAYFPNVTISFFGSRVGDKFKETSDLDVCLKADVPLDLSKWSQLESDLSQSSLPYKVDLLDWSRITDDFRKVISAKSVLISSGS